MLTLYTCVGFGGSKLWAPRTLIIMTHADLDPASALASRPANDEEFYEQLMQQHSADISIEPHIFRLDSHQAMGAEMKLLRQTIATIKKHVIEV